MGFDLFAISTKSIGYGTQDIPALSVGSYVIWNDARKSHRKAVTKSQLETMVAAIIFLGDVQVAILHASILADGI